MWGLGLRDYASAACMLDGFVALCGAMLVGKGHVSLHDRFTYVGDLVHDGYLAMWQLAISYYETQIYASGCGNFGSNATLPDDIQHTSSLNSSFSPFGRALHLSA